MLRRKRAEVHVNQERWLVSYADFITLLFAFFVVMYSISQVNQSKYRVLSETLIHAFPAVTPATVDPSENNQTAALERTLNPIQIGQPALSPASSAIDVRSEHTGHPTTAPQDIFIEISALVSARFDDLIRDQLISVSSNELWLKIEMKDSILFSSGSADPSLQAQVIFEEIALILKDYPNPVQVEGYTDNIPITSVRYPSNWELSSARASAIVKWLASKGVEPARLSAVGFGEYQPIATNDTAEGRAQNRRIALMIARKALPRPGVELSESSSIPTQAPVTEPLEIPTPDGAPAQLSTPETSAASSSVVPVAAPEETTVIENLVPVELEDGGLLFTSDPDLPRHLP